MIQYLPNYVPNVLDLSQVGSGPMKWDIGNEYYQMGRPIQFGPLPTTSPTNYEMYHRYDHDRSTVSAPETYNGWTPQAYGRINPDTMTSSQTWVPKSSTAQLGKNPYQPSPLRERPIYNELRMNETKGKGNQSQSPPESPAIHKAFDYPASSRRLSEIESSRTNGSMQTAPSGNSNVRNDPLGGADTRRRSTVEAGHIFSDTPCPLPQMSSRPAPPPRLRAASPPLMQPPPDLKPSPKAETPKVVAVIRPIPRKEQVDPSSLNSSWKKPEAVVIADVVPKNKDSSPQYPPTGPSARRSTSVKRRDSSLHRGESLQPASTFRVGSHSPPSRQPPIAPASRTAQRSQTHTRSMSSGAPKAPLPVETRNRRLSPSRKVQQPHETAAVSRAYSPPREPPSSVQRATLGPATVPASAFTSTGAYSAGQPAGYTASATVSQGLGASGVSPRSKLQHERDLRKQRRRMEADGVGPQFTTPAGRLQIFLFPPNPQVGDTVQAFSSINDKQTTDDLIYWWFLCNDGSDVGECLNNADGTRGSSALHVPPSFAGRRLKIMALHVSSKATAVTYSDVIR